ncbi:hypothetical protein ACFSLT_31600 [Novosphingobium resinovorum]
MPVLINDAMGMQGNPWEVSFLTMFHMSNDSSLFRTAAQLTADGWVREGMDWVKATARMVPLYEAKMIHHFDHRWATYDGIEVRDTSVAEKRRIEYEVTPRYWIDRVSVADRYEVDKACSSALMGWRDISLSSVERTVIATWMPIVGANHKLPLLRTKKSVELQSALLANLICMVHDFVARQKLSGSSLTYFYLKQFPILPPSAYSETDIAYIVPRVLELTYTSHSMAPIARDLGYEGAPFAWDEDRRAELRAELDAWYALAYGLTRDELRYVLDPKDVMGPDYPSETFRVLRNNEIRKYGEYRTQRLVLTAYDQLAAAAPDVSTVSDGAWDHRVGTAIDVRHIFAAIMKKTVGPVAPLDVRLTALFAAKPHLLMHYLTPDMQAQWQRLVGDQVNLQATPNVAVFSAASSQAFRDAVDQLRAERSILYNAQSRMWDRGAEIYHYAPLAWADGRAAFALHAMRNIVTQNAIAALPQEEREWIAAAA